MIVTTLEEQQKREKKRSKGALIGKKGESVTAAKGIRVAGRRADSCRSSKGGKELTWGEVRETG